MLQSVLIAFWRSFTRRPLYAALNLLGLSLGVAAFVTLSLLHRFETGYDRWTPERDKIYAAAIAFNVPGVAPGARVGAMGGLLEEMKLDYPQVRGVRDWTQPAVIHRGAGVSSEQIELVDADFLTFFQVPLIAGDRGAALRDPADLVLSETMARKYFGAVDVVGRRLEISDLAGRNAYTVTAVLQDLPKNSNLRLDFMRLLTPRDIATTGGWNIWGIVTLQAYFKFDDPAEVPALEAQLPGFVDRRVGKAFGDGVTPHDIMRLSFVPLADVHLVDPKQRAAIEALRLVGWVALGLALINYVNLATARAGLRAREVAVRKALGAGAAVLRLQFLGEAGLTIALAFLIGLAMVELALPLINAAGGLSLGLDYRVDGAWVAGVFGLVLAAGLAAAVYPAFMLSAYQPAQVLASSRTPSGGRFGARLREGLITVQFAAVVAAFVLMLGFLGQIRHMQAVDFGFRRDGLYLVTATRGVGATTQQRQAFWSAVQRIPGVTGVAAGSAAPADQTMESNSTATRLDRPTRPELSPTLNWSAVGPDYFQTLGTSLVAGRLLDLAHGGDEQYVPNAGPETVTNAVISRAAVRQLGYASPQDALDKLLDFQNRKTRIVGVVEDMRFYSPTEKTPAKLYTFNGYPAYWPVGWPITLVRYSGLSEAEVRARLEAAWRQAAPDVPFEGKTALVNLDRYYKPQRDRTNLFSLGAMVGAGIGCIGLYGLAAFNASRRTREIGVRKVLGATRAQVARLLIGQFLRPVAVACLVAWPLAYWMLRRWLSQFDDPVAVGPLVFVAGAAAAIAIGLMAVGGLAWSAASAEPGRALRHD
ncbi:FtsX-like permease family protein [Caulobacter sp. UNC279MFTsu5.1]|uniref:FtsX-like permease family protein n=1 Tax=Caulobacter sp. UNC279MFTsu5.1 TaxID=1502775 RepID=UPI000363DF5A|nr:FtsX-like permease family protein [Caulobacter sp. UNC279MFTsu5.1]SFK37041.1 putative ABC transport system permease protein [Caulobacter sp. UNC279MFTsu5.1]